MDTGYILLASITSLPAVINAFICYAIARHLGAKAYHQTQDFKKSLLAAASLFLILDFGLLIAIVYGIGLLFSGSDLLLILLIAAGPYRVYVDWALKIILIFILYYSLRKESAKIIAGTSVNPSWLVRATPLLIILAVLSVVYPLYRMYQSVQISNQMQAHMSQVSQEVAAMADQNAVTIQNALEEYRAKSGMYPETLDVLVPAVLAKLPNDPRARTPEYAVNASRTDYRLCIYNDEGKRCWIQSAGTWSPLRGYCSGEKPQPGVDCQAGLAPEATPFD